MPMIKLPSSRALLPTLLLGVIFLAALFGGPADAAPRVLATIKPVHALVARVMAGIATPDLLIAGAASEHGYALKPSDARKIAAADLIIWVGPDLETYLLSSLDTLGGRAMSVPLEYATGVTRLPARHGGLWQSEPGASGHDPHIWLSPANAIAMTWAIAAALSKADPANRTIYGRNAAASAAALKQLSIRTKAALTPVQRRPYIVFHDAYQYYENAFSLAPIGAVTVAPDRPVGPRRLAELRQAIAERQAVCIFREPQFSPALIDSLRAGSEIRVGILDPIGAALKPGPELYDQLIDRLTASLRSCLLHP